MEVSEKIKANEIFARYAGSLSDEITAQCPAESTAYDIQAAAFKIAKKRMPEILSATEIEALKKVAFDYSIILDDMWIIFGILLRDKTLAERNIPVIEVDRHSPT